MTTRFAVDIIKPLNTEAYRSGHNEAVLKTVWVKTHGGSNPSASASYGWHPQVAKENGEKATLRFFFVFLKDHPSQATAEGQRNNVTGLLHNPYSVATKLLLTNPYLRQRKARQQPCLFHATAEGRRNNVSLHFVSPPPRCTRDESLPPPKCGLPESRKQKDTTKRCLFYLLRIASPHNRLRQREDEITYRYTSFRSPSLHSGRIPASANARHGNSRAFFTLRQRDNEIM